MIERWRLLLAFLPALARAGALSDLEGLAARGEPRGRLERLAERARFEPLREGPAAAASREEGPLASKAALIEARARREHRPWMGLIASIQLDERGSFAGYRSLSDAAIFTGIYVAAQAYRFGATRDPQALEAMEESLRGLHALHEATGIPGLIAGGLVPKGYAEARGLQAKKNYIPGRGRYAAWYWIDNTSHDQYDGWLYGVAAAWPFIKDPELRSALREDLRAIGRHAVKNNLRIVGPAELIDFRANWYYQERWPSLLPKGLPLPPWRGGAAMHGLHIMLVVAALTGDKEFRDFYEEEMIIRRELDVAVEEAGAHFPPELLRRYAGLLKPLAKAFYGADIEVRPEALRASLSMNLAHMALHDLCRLETEPELKARYCAALARTHAVVAGEGNTFWDFLHASQAPEGRGALDAARESLRLFPEDAAFGVRRNSDDPSIPKYKGIPEKIHKRAEAWEWYSEKPLPFDRRVVHAAFAWQSNPYRLDGGYENVRGPGADYLVAYWLGRYYGLVAPRD